MIMWAGPCLSVKFHTDGTKTWCHPESLHLGQNINEYKGRMGQYWSAQQAVTYVHLHHKATSTLKHHTKGRKIIVQRGQQTSHSKPFATMAWSQRTTLQDFKDYFTTRNTAFKIKTILFISKQIWWQNLGLQKEVW